MHAALVRKLLVPSRVGRLAPHLRSIIATILVLAAGRNADAFTKLEGEIDGARWAAAVPDQWSGTLLLLAHGEWPQDAPHVADLDVAPGTALRTLVDEGWLVATTSYRRNGLVLGDAISDIEALRDHLIQTQGTPQYVLVDGESMGGFIVTWLAEQRPERYSAALAIGAALDLREGSTTGLSLQPQIPVLFVSNKSEIDGPIAYLHSPLPRQVDPVIFQITRDGHVNLNEPERLLALRSLLAWVQRGPSALPHPPAGQRFYDATQAPDPGPSRAVFDADGQGCVVDVDAVDPVYGNCRLALQPEDLATLALGKGSWFQLVSDKAAYRVKYGRSFDSVDRGAWVVFADASGWCTLARNFANAATTAGLTPATKVHLRRYGTQKKSEE